MRRLITRNIGTSSVLLVAVAFLLSWLAALEYAQLKILSAILLGGFIGGFTNTVAIRMMFERYWYLPGSGVILKKREDIVNSLADTVETHIINPEMLEDKMRRAVEKVDTNGIQNALNAVIDEFRDDVLEAVNSDAAHAKVVERLEALSGFWGRILNGTGIIHFDVLAHKILDGFDSQVSSFKITDSTVQSVMEKTGTLEEFIFQPNNSLLIKHYDSNESLAALLFNRLNIREVVIDKLSKYPAAKIRDIVQDNIREHLAWLEVFGVILGILFSAAFMGLNHVFEVWGGGI